MTSRSTRTGLSVAVVATLAMAPLVVVETTSQASGGAVFASALVVDGAWETRVGPDGSYYVTGDTPVDGMPTTPGSYTEPDSNGRGAFVTRYDPTGRLVSQYTIGGNVRAVGDAMAIGEDGSVYVAGSVIGANGFPTTPGAMGLDYHGNDGDNYVAKFSPDGSTLEYATILPGVFTVIDMEVDDQGRAILTGGAYSDLPTTPGALQPDPPGADTQGSYVVELNAAGTAYRWATFLGGSTGDDLAIQVELGPDGTVVVGGETGSDDFPVTPGAVDTGRAGYRDTFVSVLSEDGTSLVASARFGGHESSEERLGGMAVSHGAVWLSGVTDATDFPTTPDAWFPTPPDYHRNPGWVARLPLDLKSFDFSTYLPARVGEIHAEPGGDAVLEAGDHPTLGFPEPGDQVINSFLYLRPDGTLDGDFSLPVTPFDFDVDRAGSVYSAAWQSSAGRTASRGSRGRHASLEKHAPCTVKGTPGDDVLHGTRGPDVICGRGGDDVLVGRGSYDVLRGGAGNDVLRGGAGIDVLVGSGGADRLVGGVRRDLGTGGAGVDRIRGGGGNDSLRGGAGRDTLTGGPGVDHCRDPQRATHLRSCER